MVESLVDRRSLLPPHRNAPILFLIRGVAEFDDVWRGGVGVMVGYGVYRGVRGMGERLELV